MRRQCKLEGQVSALLLLLHFGRFNVHLSLLLGIQLPFQLSLLKLSSLWIYVSRGVLIPPTLFYAFRGLSRTCIATVSQPGQSSFTNVAPTSSPSPIDLLASHYQVANSCLALFLTLLHSCFLPSPGTLKVLLQNIGCFHAKSVELPH